MRFYTKKIFFILILILLAIVNIYNRGRSLFRMNSRYEIQRDTRTFMSNKGIIQDTQNNDDVDENKGLEKTNNETNNIETRKTKASEQSDYNNNNVRAITKSREVAQLGQSHTSGTCNSTVFQAHFKTAQTWQPVDNDKTMYVFSAYYVKARKGVFIIGVKPRRPVKVVCQLWTWNKKKGVLVLSETHGKVRAPQEGVGQRFTSTIFMCPISQADMPTYVSLVTKSCDNPLNLLHVNNASETRDYKQRFTVCLSPLNFRYGRAYELVEWIELNKILGANKFVVYNYSSARNVEQVFEYYSKRNLTEVVQWRLPMGVDTFPKTNNPVEINYFGQTAALNDCLFRSKQFSEFVVNLDLDEFIVPHSKNAKSWHDIINQVDHTSVYIFRNTFFRKDWPKTDIHFSGKKLAEQFQLVTLQFFQHEENILPARVRSKYIARTADVDLLLTHEVPNAHVVTVPVEKGLLHHYRDWENPNDNKEKVTDATVLQKFEDTLIEQVKRVWKDLVHVKMNMPIM